MDVCGGGLFSRARAVHFRFVSDLHAPALTFVQVDITEANGLSTYILRSVYAEKEEVRFHSLVCIVVCSLGLLPLVDVYRYCWFRILSCWKKRCTMLCLL